MDEKVLWSETETALDEALWTAQHSKLEQPTFPGLTPHTLSCPPNAALISSLAALEPIDEPSQPPAIDGHENSDDELFEEDTPNLFRHTVFASSDAATATKTSTNAFEDQNQSLRPQSTFPDGRQDGAGPSTDCGRSPSSPSTTVIGTPSFKRPATPTTGSRHNEMDEDVRDENATPRTPRKSSGAFYCGAQGTTFATSPITSAGIPDAVAGGVDMSPTQRLYIQRVIDGSVDFGHDQRDFGCSLWNPDSPKGLWGEFGTGTHEGGPEGSATALGADRSLFAASDLPDTTAHSHASLEEGSEIRAMLTSRFTSTTPSRQDDSLRREEEAIPHAPLSDVVTPSHPPSSPLMTSTPRPFGFPPKILGLAETRARVLDDARTIDPSTMQLDQNASAGSSKVPASIAGEPVASPRQQNSEDSEDSESSDEGSREANRPDEESEAQPEPKEAEKLPLPTEQPNATAPTQPPRKTQGAVSVVIPTNPSRAAQMGKPISTSSAEVSAKRPRVEEDSVSAPPAKSRRMENDKTDRANGDVPAAHTHGTIFLGCLGRIELLICLPPQSLM